MRKMLKARLQTLVTTRGASRIGSAIDRSTTAPFKDFCR
jgi:hypothetical protein